MDITMIVKCERCKSITSTKVPAEWSHTKERPKMICDACKSHGTIIELTPESKQYMGYDAVLMVVEDNKKSEIKGDKKKAEEWCNTKQRMCRCPDCPKF